MEQQPDRHVTWGMVCAATSIGYCLSVLASSVICLLLIQRDSRPATPPIVNTNTNVIHDPRADVHREMVERAWNELKDKRNGL
jgi:hypothetical protein